VSLVAQRPDSAPPRPWRFPPFERRRLDNGLHLLLCHLPGRPMAGARLILDAGAVAEPAGRAGIATVAARSLTEGTERLDGHALAEALETLGADVGGEMSWDAMHIRLDVPGARLAAALELLAEVARTPGFRPADVTRVRDQRLDQLQQEKVDPNALASRGLERAVWADGSAYRRALTGDEEGVADLDADAVSSWYSARLAAAPATLVVAGDLAELDVAGVAERTFGSWPATAEIGPSPVVEEVAADRRVVLIDRPGSVQSMLAMGHAGPPRRTPDYVPLTLAGVVLGGVFGSRLNTKLREEKGYTYGAHAGFETRRDGGVFAARSAVRTEDTAAAAVDAVAEIERTHADGIPEDELAPIRDYRVGVYPIAYERPSAVAVGLADLVTHGLPDGWFDTVREAMGQATAEEVSAAAARYLRPAHMAVVVVGDAAKIAADLEAAGIGPVEAGAG
jgi:zinc protease